MLYSMTRLLKNAEARKYAVGYFEAFNMDSMLACLDAAEKTRSPVIIGFGGQFLSSSKRDKQESVFHYAAVAKEAAIRADVPVATILNEADEIGMAFQGISAGFSCVMYQKAGESMEDTIRYTQELCRVAHFSGVEVEGEVGELPMSKIAEGTIQEGQMTDPLVAQSFILRTGIDALAISIGNIHLLEGSKAQLDLDLLDRIRDKVDIPLVLHGGTGVDPDDMRHAIRRGISKVNVGTVIKRVYLDAIKSFISKHNIDQEDPHTIIGWGGENDMLDVARRAMVDKVSELMEVFGSTGEADMFN